MTAWNYSTSQKKKAAIAACAAALMLSAFWALPGASQSTTTSEEPPLPTRLVIDIDSPERALYRIAVPNLLGSDDQLGAQGAEVIRNDLTLVSLFKVLSTRSFIADLEKEGLGFEEPPWSAIGAQGVVKGQVSGAGNSLLIDMRFYELARGGEPLLQKSYRGGKGEVRGFMHDFANEILRVLTGKKGVFGSRVTFARRIGPGRKDIYVADFDGHKQGRVSSGKGLSMLPNFGPGGIWYSVLSKSGMFITNSGAKGKPVIRGSGLNMGVSICGGRAYFSSTRDGNSEIYSSNLSGGDVRRLTRHPAIDVSPTCAGGNIVFVSSRHGGPQVFMMGGGGGAPKRLTYKGEHNQTPAFCQDPKEGPLLAFSGRDGGGFDIFTLNLKSGKYTRLTQGQGINQDPAFSADCRMVAFASSRGGLFISSPEGLNQNKVISGAISTVRWSR